MFNNDRGSDSSLGSTEIQTLISEGTVIVGDIRFKGGLHIDGEVEGAVICTDEEGLVIVSDNGKVKGSIKAPRIIINGVLEGDVTSSDRLELEAKAKIKGNLNYHKIQMQFGAEVTGELSSSETGPAIQESKKTVPAK